MNASIIIPAFNEEHGLRAVLDEILGVYPDGEDVEILVVDDASEDGTREVAEAFMEEKKDWPGTLRLIRHEENRGYGASLKTGIREASHDIIVITDGDNTYPASSIPDLVRELEECDMAVGARTGGSVRIPLVRRPAKWFLGSLANYLARQKIPDINSGLRAFRKEAALHSMKLLPDGFSFTTTITMSLLTDGYAVSFIPVDYRQRAGRSKIRPIRDTIGFLALIVRTSVYFNPLRVFMPISLLLAAVAAGVFYFSWRQGQILDATVSILLMTGVQVAVLGLLADLIVRRAPDEPSHLRKPDQP